VAELDNGISSRARQTVLAVRFGLHGHMNRLCTLSNSVTYLNKLSVRDAFI
jgi:hypothetical protein